MVKAPPPLSEEGKQGGGAPPLKSKREGESWVPLILWTGGLAVLGFALFQGKQTLMPPPLSIEWAYQGIHRYVPTPPETLQLVKYKVETEEANAEDDLATRMLQVTATQERPLIIKNSIATEWPVFEKWSFFYILRMKEWLQNVQVHSNQTYIYQHFNGLDNSMLRIPSVANAHAAKSFTKKDVHWETFLKHLKNPTGSPGNGEFYTYATTLDDDFFLRWLAQDAKPIDPLVVDWRQLDSALESQQQASKYEPEAVVEGDSRPRKRQLWIGPAGSTTHCHFDGFYNFFVQVAGVKRFIVFPPKDHKNLYVLPFIHPGAFQSQVDFSHPDFERFPALANASGYEAILRAGDVLYLPPLWFHHVVTEQASISLSVWSSPKYTSKVYANLDNRLPFPKAWLKSHTKPIAHLGARVLMDEVLLRVTGSEEGRKAFLEELWETRWRRLSDEFPDLLGAATESFCLKALEERAASMTTLAEVRDKLSRVIGEAADVFLLDVDEEGRREIFLGDWIEKKADHAVDVFNVARFIRDLIEC